MDDLSTIIHSLDAAEQLEFQNFIQRDRYKKQRKDLKLFELLLGEEQSASELQKELELPNANAYHALRRRLYQHLSDFVLIRSTQEEMSSMSRVNGMLSMARHLFSTGSDKLAWKILERAERMAAQNELYEVLNTIYMVQVEMFDSAPKGSLNRIIKRFDANKEKLILSERAAIAKGVIREKVLKFKKGGQDVDLAAVLNESVQAFELKNQMIDIPKLLFTLLETIRGAVVASKDFHSFEPIVEQAFSSLAEKGDHHYNARILYMLAHTRYRNKRFSASQVDLLLIEAELDHCSRSFRRTMLHKVAQLRAGNSIFLNELDKAISILEGLLEDKMLAARSANNVRLNLVVYYFFNAQAEKARDTMNQLQRSDKWYKEHMGIEWLLKRDLNELLLYHELNEPDLVSSRIRSIQRKYKELFKQHTYKRVEIFIGLVKEYVENEMLIDLEALEEKVEMSWEWLPKEEEDLQAMMFYAWFRSKLSQKGLYATVLELIVGA